MSYTLWGEPGSGSFMIEAALAEADQTVELIDLDLTKDEHRSEAFLAINPSGKVPALRFPDGEVMTQSAAILLALDEAHPRARLMPAVGAVDRRFALRWAVHIAAEIYPLIEISDYPLRFAPPETSEVGMRSLVRRRIRERWLLMERQAAGEGSFLLSGFSAIDLAVAVISDWAVGPEWRCKECPKLDAIAKAVARREKIAPIWRRHFPQQPA
ncbi:glutathione S-transferase family protein [Labrys wisconsinensis]|uniref:Glutathione S-transferase n=1 Tax=Labrys wisconsinensis TaxID=425677 RepID=A0ABU0JKQ0_9HYPH|nr:glutathione S-transferase family protein [Labrys wisconsinensis]MDQ0474860.1 glutathione S-transferase [Labrys wisconsinensis]